jgi:hypothetical protein
MLLGESCGPGNQALIGLKTNAKGILFLGFPFGDVCLTFVMKRLDLIFLPVFEYRTIIIHSADGLSGPA